MTRESEPVVAHAVSHHTVAALRLVRGHLRKFGLRLILFAVFAFLLLRLVPSLAQALESLEGGPGARPEDAVGIDGRARQYGGQAMLHVGDRVTTVPDGEGQAYR